MVRSIKNGVIVGAMVTIAMVVALVYAQQNQSSGNNIEPFRVWWNHNTVNTTQKALFKQFCSLRFKWFCNPVKLQFIEISDEYRVKVIDILKSNPDVQSLLRDGYNITMVKPMIKLYVKGDGSVELRASQSYVCLYKSGVERVVVLVDVEANNVIKIFQCQIMKKVNN